MSTVTPASQVAQAVHERRHKQRVEALATYRKFIEQSHAGKKLTEAETAKVVDAMYLLELPDDVVEADIAAWDRNVSYGKALAEIPGRRQKLQPELERMTARIKALRDELREVERDYRVKCHEGSSIVALEGQAAEFRGQHPRLFSDNIDRACAPVQKMLEFSPRPPESHPNVPFFSTR